LAHDVLLNLSYQSGPSYCSRVTTWSPQHSIGQSCCSWSSWLRQKVKVSHRTIPSEIKSASMEKFVRRGTREVSCIGFVVSIPYVPIYRVASARGRRGHSMLIRMNGRIQQKWFCSVFLPPEQE